MALANGGTEARLLAHSRLLDGPKVIAQALLANSLVQRAQHTCFVARVHLERSCELAEACRLGAARAVAFEDLAAAHALAERSDDAWDALAAALASWEQKDELEGVERAAARVDEIPSCLNQNT